MFWIYLAIDENKLNIKSETADLSSFIKSNLI